MRMLLVVSTGAALAIVSAGLAADKGTPEEAKAMLERAVDALKADKEAALAAFNDGDPDFRDKDLYVFCGDEQGNFTAYGADPSRVGQDMRDVKDEAGEPSGEMMYEAGVEGEINTVESVWPRPGATEGSEKVSYVTKVEDQTCAVGYYK